MEEPQLNRFVYNVCGFGIVVYGLIEGKNNNNPVADD